MTDDAGLKAIQERAERGTAEDPFVVARLCQELLDARAALRRLAGVAEDALDQLTKATEEALALLEPEKA